MKWRRWCGAVGLGSWSVAFAIAACMSLAGCAKPVAEGAESGASATVSAKIGRVEHRTIEDRIVAPGQWKSGGDVIVAAPFAGALESLRPRIGDRVKAGEAIGVILTRESKAALRGAELLAIEAHDDAGHAEAERALAIARRDLVRLPLIAPGAGTVVRRSAEAGAEVPDGAELLAFVPDGALVFEARVGAAEAARLRAGQPASIACDGLPARPARVQRVLPAANAGDQATLAWLEATGAGATPAIDRFGTATIRAGLPRTVLAVPADAVDEDDLTGEHRVAVLGADSVAVWTTVDVGPALEGWRELRGSALPAGTRVLVEGLRGLPDHTRVTPQP